MTLLEVFKVFVIFVGGAASAYSVLCFAMWLARKWENK